MTDFSQPSYVNCSLSHKDIAFPLPLHPISYWTPFSNYHFRQINQQKRGGGNLQAGVKMHRAYWNPTRKNPGSIIINTLSHASSSSKMNPSNLSHDQWTTLPLEVLPAIISRFRHRLSKLFQICPHGIKHMTIIYVQLSPNPPPPMQVKFQGDFGRLSKGTWVMDNYIFSFWSFSIVLKQLTFYAC